MRFTGYCYRGHEPKYSWLPISGVGASIGGGRFNRPGIEALYLSLSMEASLLELGYGLSKRVAPLLWCGYDVDMEDVVDLRNAAGRADAGVKLADLKCAWKEDVRLKRDPISWQIADNLINRGASGILVQSFANGANRNRHHNLVLWRWSDTLPHQVRVFDPYNALPKDQSSWPP